MRRGFSLVISIMVMLAIVGVGFGCAPKAAPEVTRYAGWPEKKVYLNYGSSSSASSYYVFAAAAAKVINAGAPNVVVTVIETGATHDNIARMDRGEIEIGHGLLDGASMCYWSMGLYEGKPRKEWMRLGWAFAAITVTNLVVRADSGVTTIKDLDGKKFNPGMRGSAAEANTMTIFEALNIKPVYYFGSTADAVAAVKDNHIVGYAKPGAGGFSLDASTLEIKAFTPIRIISLGEKNVEILKKELPWLSWVKVPANAAFEGCPEYWACASPAYIYLHKDIPEELGYHMIKAAFSEKGVSDQRAAFPATLDDPKYTIELDASLDKPVPLHPGTVRYLREQGYEVPDALIPPEMK